jgi:predicted TPR repeat methyltransferase
MISAARKKMLYNTLYVMTIKNYFEHENKGADFDIVVASDVLAYIGELNETFSQVRS